MKYNIQRNTEVFINIPSISLEKAPPRNVSTILKREFLAFHLLKFLFQDRGKITLLIHFLLSHSAQPVDMRLPQYCFVCKPSQHG
mmetsp:Transcript_8042/g.11494  ORF Transcript_8042/g.11494 Transcript_8042/m.11494 type:complete len:85 (+) Transcript_8042:373-627(+)